MSLLTTFFNNLFTIYRFLIQNKDLIITSNYLHSLLNQHYSTICQYSSKYRYPQRIYEARSK